ncbi:VOC family protein [Mycobacteroides abscessus]|uniref:VOC family protein n=1 Tax=Mycobacteroides abscessus TaxID=36809 RepID=UPI000C2561B0|nr:VOC family protein [Mycobacteroides abscessus]
MTLTLLVLYVSDPERSRDFYYLIGLDFTEQRHQGGPVHHAAELPSGIVLELYPAGDHPVTRTRLGFEVRGRAAVAEALRAAGFTVKRQSLAIDPDGNRVEITDSEAVSRREADAALSARLGRDELT